MSSLEAIRYSNGNLEILDQLLLPHSSTYLRVDTVEMGYDVIRNMQVSYAVFLTLKYLCSYASRLPHETHPTKQELCSYVTQRLDRLVAARPTAVNMQQESQKLKALAEKLFSDDTVDVQAMKQRLMTAAEDLLQKDVADNKAIGEHGTDHLLSLLSPSEPVKVLTHCNTGSLATAGYGTALGIVRSLHSRGKLEHVYCTETRPYNQGARLTAYELVHEKMPATLICDSMVAAAMREHGIKAVIVGADRVAANGDTANKIGTYQLAVLAKHHNVLFYVAAPFSSIDFGLKSGKDIPIELRPHTEMTHVNGRPLAAPGINCWNPGFDVTPAELITGGIVTEKGVFPASSLLRSTDL
nr:EOG090X08IP [Triops cancriformis]